MGDVGLEGVMIVEKDKNGEVLSSWMYPGVSPEMEHIVTAHSFLTSDPPLFHPYHFFKFKDTWVYLQVQEVQEAGALSQVTAFALALFCKYFDPEKYHALSTLLATIYLTKGNTVPLLQAFLSVFTTGNFSFDNISYKDSDYDVRKAYLVTNIKDVIRMFRTEIILLWTALMTKKRIVIYAEKVGILLKLIRAVPLLIFHKQNWNFLRPYVQMNPIELDELKRTDGYCAGFTDPSIRTKEEYYDLFVDVNARRISFPDHAKTHFQLGGFHKEIAAFLTQSAEDENTSDQLLIKNLTVKVKEFLAKLQKLAVPDPATGTNTITMAALQEKKLPIHMQHFLFAVATAEGMSSGAA